MPDLVEAARVIVANPCVPPTPVEVLAERVRLRRRRRKLGAVGAGVAVLVAASAGLSAVVTSAQTHPVAVSPRGASVPAFRVVLYQEVSIEVPDNWTVVDSATPPCPVRNEVLLGDVALPSCEVHDNGPLSFVRLSNQTLTSSGGTPVMINGHEGRRWSHPSYQQATFPDLNITVTIFGLPGTIAGSILQSLRSAPQA